MTQIGFSSGEVFQVKTAAGSFTVNGKEFNGTLEKVNSKCFKVILPTQIFTVEVVENTDKIIVLKLNNRLTEVSVTNPVDDVLKKLGIDLSGTTAVKEVKAPMPGSIMSVHVAAGDEIEENDPLLILEAMKMENVIKSPNAGMVSKVWIKQGDNVEKNQVLVSFE